MKYPFFIMSQLIKAKVLAHENKIVDTKDLYESLEYVCEMLEKWNTEQFKEEADK